MYRYPVPSPPPGTAGTETCHRYYFLMQGTGVGTLYQCRIVVVVNQVENVRLVRRG